MREFILQGFTSRTHVSALGELLDLPDIQRAILSVAFVSESGVQQIEEQLQRSAQVVTVFAGIRNEITSYQGLSRLYDLGCKLFTVDTGSRLVLFHPKLYMVRNDSLARLIVGSANLTLGGLNNNIEAGLYLELDMTDPTDRAFVEEIESEFDVLPANYPANVVEVAGPTALEELLARGRLVDEMALPPPQPRTSAGGGAADDTVPRIALKVPPLRRALRKATAARTTGLATSSEITDAATLPLAAASIGIDLELVWESKPLTRRDLTIPATSGTHRTGSINLDKGLLPEEVDHRHYFRDEVFSQLAWSAKSRDVDEAFATFHLILKGISYGESDLAIRHSHSTTSKTYRQRNATTRLSWGRMSRVVARKDLIGRTLALYRDNGDPNRFVLEID